MTIVFDCFKFVKGTGKSIGIYNLTLNLIRNLAADNQSAGNHDKLIVLGNKHNREDFDIPGVTFVTVKYNPLNKIICILWELVLVTTALKRIKPDIAVFSRGFAPLKWLYKGKTYVIIHDMIPFYYDKNYPGVLNKYENAYIMNRLKASARSATGVIAVSEYSKNDIVRIAKVPADKVHVIYNGINLIDKVNDVTSISPDILGGAALPKDYICAVCSGLPHKNAEGVIKSYDAYYKSSNAPIDIVIIGIENTDEYSPDAEVKKHIRCIRYIGDNEDMYGVIKGSRLFWFLSRQEGFGFPPLEAMQLGVPVICSNASSLPEIVGNAAVLVDPEDHHAVAGNTVQMLSEDNSMLVKAGYENVKNFLWEKQVKEYKKVLR